MGVYTFVCRNSGGEWTAKQHEGELGASAATPYDLQRRLVAAASAEDSAVGVQSSFTMVTPSSAVCQVVIGAVGGGAMIAGGAAAGGAAAASGGAAVEATKAEEKKEEAKEESEDEDMGFSLFD